VLSLTSWLKVHWFWLVFIGLGLMFAHAWLGEHDARMKSDAKVKVSEANVAVLQKQVTGNDEDITALKVQMAQNDAQARQQVVALTQLVATVKTAPQAAQAIGQVSGGTVTPVAQQDGSMTIPQPQVVPLLQELAQGKEDAVNLTVCKSDLATTQTIVAKTEDDVTAEKAIVVQKDTEIAALKKKPGFWHRVGSTLKQVGIGFAVGYIGGKVL
jgi:hypothetical protein